MDGSIERSDDGPDVLAGIWPTSLDDSGLGIPAATCHTPRPGEGRDGDTAGCPTRGGACAYASSATQFSVTAFVRRCLSTPVNGLRSALVPASQANDGQSQHD